MNPPKKLEFRISYYKIPNRLIFKKFTQTRQIREDYYPNSFIYQINLTYDNK